ncbi:MAG: glycosyltransferase family 4 protein [Acidobacteriota bacterium]
MKIAMIDPGAMTPFYDEALCSALAAAGAEVDLYTAPFPHLPLPAARGFRRHHAFARFLATKPGPSGQRWARRLRRGLAYPGDWRRLRRLLAERPPDVVHLQWSLLPWLDRGALKSLRRRGLPLVLTAHNALPHDRPTTRRRAWARLWSSADHLIAPSRFTAARVAAIAPQTAPRTSVIPLGDHRPWSRPRHGQAAARERLGLSPDAPLALFYGLLKDYKGILPLLDAFALCRQRLPAARLALCGALRSSLGAIEGRLATHRLEDAIHRRFAYLSLAETQLWFEAADLVVLPYTAASQSMIPAMAYTFARPVLATAVGAFPEQVVSGETGDLVPAADSPALGERLAELLADRSLCHRLGAAGAAWAEQRWAWPTIAADTLAVYRKLR